MVKVTTLYLMQLCLFYGTNHVQARLPKWVFRVDSCPLPNNISKWQDASRRLHCLHDLNATDMGNTYHCLPSGYLNETVEFCGKGRFIPPGHCPFYDYKVNADDIPDLYNCSAFISGCPTKTFASKDVRKFFSCLNINSIYRCYEEESNCPKTSATLVPTKITNDIKTATNSELSTIPTVSSTDITQVDDKIKYVSVIICVVILIGLIALMVLLYKRKFPCQQTDLILKIKKDTPTIANGENTHNVQIEDTGFVPPDTQKVSEAECEHLLKKDTIIAKTNPPELNDFTHFFEKIRGLITDDMWHAMKLRLCDFLDHERVKKMNPNEMLNELSDMLKLQYNMGFLEWMFDKCEEPKLVTECQDFAAKNQCQLECFNTHFTPSDKCRPLEFQLRVFELESYRDELQDLRYWLAKTIHVHPGQILMTALKNEPIVVTFLMNENHGNAVLEYLNTDDGRIAASRKEIEKIVQNGNVIEIGKALNGSNFVQIRLRIRKNSVRILSGLRAGVSTVASIFLRRTGIRMEGNEVYTETVPSNHKTNETKEESFIEKNRGLILENIEPLTIENTYIASLFNREDLAGMKDITGRRDRAEYFLKLCAMLPKEEREKAYAYLEVIVSLPEEKSTYDEELFTAKKWIQQNRENLLDEIDSDFIKSTIYHFEDVPEEVKSSWFDPNKSRTEKAKIFLDFALQKDDYVKALKKTMEEYEMQFPE